jgi:hypothetical protein
LEGLYQNGKNITSGKLLRVQKYDQMNSSTIKFEKSVKHKVRKRGSSRTMKNLKKNLLEWLKYKYRKMDSDNFDEFPKSTKAINDVGMITAMFNNKFQMKIRGNWFRNIRFVDDDCFKIVNENMEYGKLWEKVIPDKNEMTEQSSCRE